METKSNIAILIVEDEGIIALNTKQILKFQGYITVDIVTSGEKALEYLAGNNYDLILMDIKLKGELDGIETTMQIKKRYNIPVIYVSAHLDESTIARAENTNPDGFIKKPIIESILLKSVKKAINNYV